VVVLAGLIIVLLWVLRSEILYIGVAVFIAVLLSPPVIWLEHHGVRRGYGARSCSSSACSSSPGCVPLRCTVGQRRDALLPPGSRARTTGRERSRQIGHLVRRFHLQQWVSKNLPKLSTLVGSVSKPALSVGAPPRRRSSLLVTIAILSFFLLLEARSSPGFLGLFPTRAPTAWYGCRERCRAR